MDTEAAVAPHLSLSTPPQDAPALELAEEFRLQGKLWKPRRVMITPEAYALPHGRAMLERAEGYGAEVIRLGSNRLMGLKGETAQKTYALAKTTFAIVVSPPGQRRLQPIPPSADWQFHVAQGCPAHCQYCYLAGSLAGPPVTRAYANLPEILEGLRAYVGTGEVTSKSRSRWQEGTTFEASCYTDPLGIEHLTGALEESIRFFGTWDAPVQLRWTTKFDAVRRLLPLAHEGRTRARFSINAASVARDFEGGTANVTQRLGGLRAMAMAGYPVGLTIAPIMPVPAWQGEYRAVRDGGGSGGRGGEAGPHGGTDHTQVYTGIEGGAGGLVPKEHTGPTGGCADAEANEVRGVQVCVSEGRDGGDAAVLRGADCGIAPGGPDSLLDVIARRRAAQVSGRLEEPRGLSVD